MTDSDDAFLFLDEAASLPAPNVAEAAPWVILVVDDDRSVHSITQLVLGDLRFQGRNVEIISAYSGREAAAILRSRNDVALILLDVVMETDDSGLRLVREVREVIGNRAVRIILRTGEPGQAPERQVILDFDINDYKAKADLTARQLFTATVAALRGYDDLCALEEARAALLVEQAELERRVIARTAELAAANRVLEDDLKAAATLQQAIQPAGFPAHPRLDGAAVMRPARVIGGDFYDIAALDDARVALLIADVSGKGAQAALFAVLARTLLQTAMAAQTDAAEILAATNQALLARNPLNLFVTVLLVLIDTQTGMLSFCSAGHGAPLIRRADGSTSRVGARPSLLLGLIDAAPYTSHSLQLAPGDAVVLTTDGIEEAENLSGEAFGQQRICATLAETAGGADCLLDALMSAVDTFSDGAPLADDATCIVARWLG